MISGFIIGFAVGFVVAMALALWFSNGPDHGPWVREYVNETTVVAYDCANPEKGWRLCYVLTVGVTSIDVVPCNGATSINVVPCNDSPEEPSFTVEDPAAITFAP